MSRQRPKEPLDFIAVGLSFVALAAVCHWEARRPEAPPAAEAPESRERAPEGSRRGGAAPDARPVDPAQQLSIVTTTPGHGRAVHHGDHVTVKVRTPTGGETTRSFVAGSTTVIPGLDEGVSGMQLGEKRRLLIPPPMAGREAPSATKPLHMDVELVAIGEAGKVE
jgi:FKBP-type peptidyl-prolyl cis-trans isomerase